MFIFLAIILPAIILIVLGVLLSKKSSPKHSAKPTSKSCDCKKFPAGTKPNNSFYTPHYAAALNKADNTAYCASAVQDGLSLNCAHCCCMTHCNPNAQTGTQLTNCENQCQKYK